MNRIHTKIHFTVEGEENNKLNYLDITIINKTSKFQHSIHRKTTKTNQTITYNFNHPPQHKVAAYNALIYRIYRNIIHQIAKYDGCDQKQ